MAVFCAVLFVPTGATGEVSPVQTLSDEEAWQLLLQESVIVSAGSGQIMSLGL